MSPVRERVVVHSAVRDALGAGRAVVALETAVLTHGLPRAPSAVPPAAAGGAWDVAAPTNTEAVRAMERAVRGAGAVPATIGALDGRLHIGMAADEIDRLGADGRAVKASASTLAAVLARGGSAGTTVSATLVACRLAGPPPIRAFATGGIGGVHPGWERRPDVSADVRLLAETPVAVVCAGAKSILDSAATLEVLETLGVPVVGFRTSVFPRFHAEGTADLPLSARCDSAEEAAALCRAHWGALGRSTAVLVAQAPPAPFALTSAELDRALAHAVDDARGADRTPALLAALTESTGGRSLVANVALLHANARLAGEIAVAMARG
jgi:pseudouridine-5'-phosphate glycosidase